MANTGNGAPTSTEPSQLARVAVKPPPFWKSDPALWFLQLDAQFKLGNISADETQFYAAISALDSEVLQSVRDIVLNPPAERKYDALRGKLIAVYAESETVRLNRLLQHLSLGDLRPSQLLAQMKDLSAGNFKDNVLQSLWLSRLPTSTQAILAASSEPLSKLAEMADKIHELALPQVHQVQAPAQPSGLEALQLQIEALTRKIEALSAEQQRCRSSSRGRGGSRQRSKSRNRFEDPPAGVCFYHHNFKNRARKCKQPCNFNSSGN